MTATPETEAQPSAHDETVTTGAPRVERPPAPSWMTRGVPEKEASSAADKTPTTHKEFVGAVVGIIEFGFGTAASRTGYDLWKGGRGNWDGYEGFRITPEEEPHLERAMTFLLRNVKVEQYFDVVSLLYLGVILGSKGWGYMSWKRSPGGPGGRNQTELNNAAASVPPGAAGRNDF